MYSMIGTLEFFCDLDIKAIDQKNHRKICNKFKEKDRQILDLDFGDTHEN